MFLLRKRKREINVREAHTIEPEEIFLDSKKEEKEETKEGRLEFPLNQKLISFIFLFLLGVFALLMGRNFYLQVLHADEFEKLSKENYLRIRPLWAPRGIIYDSAGKPLTLNTLFYSLYFDYARSLKENQFDEDLAILRDAFSFLDEKRRADIFSVLTREKLEARSRTKQDPLLLIDDIPPDIAESLIEIDFTSPHSGIQIEARFRRSYDEENAFSHLLGYVGTGLNKEESPDYFLKNQEGVSGIEAYYNDYLRGENGEILTFTNARGGIEREARGQDPQIGNNVYLAIDRDLQVLLWRTLTYFSRSYGGRAAAVALDPRDGSVRAMVSTPGFPATKLSSGIREDEFEGLLRDPSKPFFNRALSGEYPPGSTIKPFVALAALEENIINPMKKIYAPGEIRIPNPYNPAITYVFPDWKEHGWVNMIDAIAVSSNVYFYQIGGGYGDLKGLGIEKLSSWLRALGFGKATGIDLLGETGGFIPTPEWKQKVKGEDWYIGDTYHAAIGQGDITMTPLQIARATALVASDGKSFTPHILERIENNDGTTRQMFHPQEKYIPSLDTTNIGVVKRGMREAVTSGSSKLLSGLPVKIAGKTGTAQNQSGRRTPHAWWTGFAPYDNPEIVLTIIVENGGEGSSVAVPVAKEVLEWYFNRK